ncbi:hypothetical protein DIX59_10155 [Streptococcus iniae]|uniref:hypothetical protein n=1 Tax=Streptococcus iniae TaxID=1346 RepID=UPI000360FF29|nr:hypothetical protein [Streptococcus iniae]ESR10529.1 PrgL [Streptococcus iniae IUSA1]KYJ81231.1 hypothetical protein NA30_04330 [Streptococcus iniae]RMI72503.1 hypothetical protein DIX59_10155 [Streptococcus iniae]HEK4517258.1 hypothetical protein [Streptococcus iniae]
MKMIDEHQVERLKKMGYIFAGIMLLLVGYGLGARGKTTDSTNVVAKPTAKKVAAKEITQKQVKNFLIAYYTKKDLEENRNRYKNYMTDPMYSQEKSLEEQPVNQTYKGFVVDYKFKSADIYIDNVNHVALAKIYYTNTLLSEKNNYDKAQKNVSNEATIRLTYQEAKGKMLVDKIESILLVSNNQTGSDYPTFGVSAVPKEEQNKGEN